MYSKPLASRMDALLEGPTRARNSQPRTADFASLLPQSGMPPVGMASGARPSPLEQAATQNNFGLNQMRAMAALSAAGNTAVSQTAGQTSGLAQSQGLPLNPRDILRLLSRTKPDAESAETALRVKAHRKSAKERAQAENVVTKAVSDALDVPRQKAGATDENMPLGRLAAKFESGNEGIAAIGYDRHGGTSYGKYQIASRVGTMRNFINFLRDEAPDIAERLEKAGPANTGGRRGKMPETWRNIAEEDPARFEALQDKFIRASHFEPAMRALEEKTGIAFNDMPAALHEVVFSTAVQHGPRAAERIVARALGQVGGAKLDPDRNPAEDVEKAHETLIRRIYANRSGQFRSSTETVQAAVKNRLRQEMSMAITMLRGEYSEA